MKKQDFSRRLRHKIRGPIVKGLLILFARVPFGVSRAAGNILGYFSYRWADKTRRIAEKNIRLCLPHLSEREQMEICQKTFLESGKTFTELGPLWLWPMDKMLKLVDSVEGEEAFKAAFKQNNGAIVLAPHLGSWEMVGLYLSAHYPITSMYRPPRIEAIEPLMKGGRERAGAHLVPTDIKGVRQLIKALKQGELIGVLPDQDPGKGNGRFAPFFGIQANTMTLLSKIAGKTGSPVFTVVAQRLPGKRGYKLIFQRAMENIDSGDEQASLNAMNQAVEKAVLAAPEQYQWTYRRFRTRPEGEEKFY